MEWLRRMLGLGLFGTAAWLLSVLAVEVGLWPAIAAGVMLLVLLILVAVRAVLRMERYAARVIAAAAIALSMGAVLAPALLTQAGAATAPDGFAQTDLWQRYDAAALQRLVAEGWVVFVDVTAVWCLICKVN